MAGSTLVCTSIKTARRGRTSAGERREENQSFASGLSSSNRQATSSGGLAAVVHQSHALLHHTLSLLLVLSVLRMDIEFRPKSLPTRLVWSDRALRVLVR